MSKWEMVKLGDVFKITSGGTPLKSKKEYYTNGTIPWVKTGDLKQKYITSRFDTITELGLKNSSAKLFPKGTVLIAMYGATIGACSILDVESSTNQACAAFLPNEAISSSYLYYFLVSQKERLTRKGVGGAQPNISATILKSVEIPLPSLNVQKQITDTLDKTQEIIGNHKKQLEELDNLIKATFYDMFGDPVINDKDWDLARLSELGELGRGVSKHRPRNAPELLGGDYPFIQTGDVSNADLYIKKYTQTYNKMGLKQSKMWKKGTLCITIAANIARTAILKFNACFPDSIVGFNANENTNNIFMHYWFGFFQKIIETQAPESAQKNINLRILNELKVIKPPLELQTKFAIIVTKIEQQKAIVNQSIQESENLFNSLMSKYFDE